MHYNGHDEQQGYERLIRFINNFEGFSWDIFLKTTIIVTIIIHTDLIFNQFIGNELLCFTLIFKVCYGWFGPAQIYGSNFLLQ